MQKHSNSMPWEETHSNSRMVQTRLTTLADFELLLLTQLSQRRQQQIDENVQRTNARRIQHNYSIGDRVMVVEYDPIKLDTKKRGPFPIVRVFTNGTVRLQIANHVQETFNIQTIWPYRGWTIKTQKKSTWILEGDSVTKWYILVTITQDWRRTQDW